MVAPMAATSAVWFVNDFVTCGNNALNARRSFAWCNGPTITQHVCRDTFLVHVAWRVSIPLQLLGASHQQH